MPESKSVEVLPMDSHNRLLVSRVHPGDWTNPEPAGRYNLVAIGGGTAGLVSAAGATGLGARCALIEKHLLGGDCLNVGCVPSKALIRSSRAVADARDAGAFGVDVSVAKEVDFASVMERMRRLRTGIAEHDSAERFRKLGVDIFLGEARFVSRDAVQVGGHTLRFARAVIATGGRAAAPPIEGLEEVGYLTNETLFSLTELPPRLGVIGGGPIGCEMAQAFGRFGSRVSLFQYHPQILDREDAEAGRRVQDAFRRKGSNSSSIRGCFEWRGGRARNGYISSATGRLGRSPSTRCWWPPEGPPTWRDWAWRRPASNTTGAAASW